MKAALVAPLAGHLGCLAVGVALYAWRAAGLPRRALVPFALLWVVGVALVAVLPYQSTILIPGKEPGTSKLAIASTVWRSAGTVALVAAAGCAVPLLVRRLGARASGPLLNAGGTPALPGWALRWSADGWFVVGWVLLEVAGYFALTPFPAARRVVGVTIVLAVLAARAVSRVTRAHPERRSPGWVVLFGIAVGVLVAALDAYDALPERVLAERAAAVRARSPEARMWFVGHWGFQYYCERAGMKPAVPGEAILEPGDYLVLPLFPTDRGFFRPDSANGRVELPAGVGERVAELVWDDALSAQTIPNFYGGIEPVLGRDHPRLQVGVYRITREWAVPGQ
jgi:hypothetical protein